MVLLAFWDHVKYNEISQINLFLSYVTFLYPWKHQKTLQFSDAFRGYRSVTLETNGRKKI